MQRHTAYQLSAVAMSVVAQASWAQCLVDGWRPIFPAAMGPANGPVDTLLTTGAPGSQITYAGGSFTQIAGRPVNRVAAWTGTEWFPLGSGFDDGTVTELIEFDDGTGSSLYAAGTFLASAGVPMRGVARWDGASWQPLGNGLDGVVNALAVFDPGSGPSLYATGTFGFSGSAPVSRVARWDGSAWRPLGIGLNNVGDALAVWNDGKGESLFVGGNFQSAGGVGARYLAKWDGTQWSSVGSQGIGFGPNGRVSALAALDDGPVSALYFTGGMWWGGWTYVNGAGRWDGSQWWPTPWEGVSPGPTANYNRIVTVPWTGSTKTLLVGGFGFRDEFGLYQQGLAQLAGGRWSSLVPEVSTFVNAAARAVATIGSGTGERLIVGGTFTAVNGRPASNIAALDTTTQQWLTDGLNGSVLAISEIPASDGDTIAVGGTFTRNGTLDVGRVMRWDGQAALAMGSGFNARVNVLHNAAGTLYAGGRFTATGTRPVKALAAWDGAEWQSVGGGIEGHVLACTSDTDNPSTNLVVAGQFTSAGGVACSNVARWNGHSWQPIGAGFDGPVHAVQYFGTGADRALYAGGAFTRSGGVTIAGIARWDGAQWLPVAGGVSGLAATVYSLKDASTTDVPMLLVGGSFSAAGDAAATNIAAWTGTAWQPMGAGLNGPVHSVDAAGVGDTTGIFAGGAFSASGSTNVARIARWDGTQWQPIGTGLGDAVQAVRIARLMARDMLVVGGNFTTSPARDAFLAMWRPCLPCIGDLNGDAFINGVDLGLLLSAWGECADCAADLNDDNAVNGDDLGLMLAAWGTCPD